MTREVPPTIASTVGAIISSIRRVLYVFQGITNTTVGALELEFDDGRTILVDSGGDGESLSVVTHAWKDPFADDLSAENRDFVAKSGKWTSVDVSRDPEYAHFIGAKVNTAEPIQAPNGKIVGVLFWTSTGNIRAEVEADALYVQVD